MTTTTDTVTDVLAEFPTNAEGREGAHDTGRWLLVERNQGGHAPAYWFTRHSSVAGAQSYHGGQEYAEDWAPMLLVDVDTGERFELFQTFGFDFLSAAPEDA